MKSLIVTVAFTVVCCIVFSQVKKIDSTKKNGTPVNNSPLAQEKIWPASSTPAKNRNGKVIPNTPVAATWMKL